MLHYADDICCCIKQKICSLVRLPPISGEICSSSPVLLIVDKNCYLCGNNANATNFLSVNQICQKVVDS